MIDDSHVMDVLKANYITKRDAQVYRKQNVIHMIINNHEVLIDLKWNLISLNGKKRRTNCQSDRFIFDLRGFLIANKIIK